MTSIDRALNWGDAAHPNTSPAMSLASAMSRRKLLLLVGAGAASTLLAAPAWPVSSAGGSASAVATVPVANLDAELFMALVGETLTARVLTGNRPDTWARFVLAEVAIPDSVPGEQRPDTLRSNPFSLLFVLGSGNPGESGIVRLEHDALGAVELFIHQVISTGDAPTYEAVLN